MSRAGGEQELEERHRSGAEIVSGQLGPVSLGALLHLAHYEGLSGWLCVARRGEIEIERGTVLDAVCGGLTGFDALRELVFHRGGRFSFVGGETRGRSVIENATLALLDAYRLRDEWAKVAGLVLQPASGGWQATGSALDGLVPLLDGRRTTAEAVAECGGYVTALLDALSAALGRGLLVRVAAPGDASAEAGVDFYELLDRAQGFMRGGNYEAAEGLLRRAIALRPDDRVAQQNLRAVLQRRRTP